MAYKLTNPAEARTNMCEPEDRAPALLRSPDQQPMRLRRGAQALLPPWLH